MGELRTARLAGGRQQAFATLEAIRHDIQVTERALLACLEQSDSDSGTKGALQSAAKQLLTLLQQAAREAISAPRSSLSRTGIACALPDAAGAAHGACMSPDPAPNVGSAAESSGSGLLRRPVPAATPALQGRLRRCQAVLAGALGQEPVQELGSVLQGLYTRRLQLQADTLIQQRAARQAHECPARAGCKDAGACSARLEPTTSTPDSCPSTEGGGKDGGVIKSSAVHAAELEARRLLGLLAEAREQGIRQGARVHALEARCAQADALRGRCLRQGDALADLHAQLRAAEEDQGVQVEMLESVRAEQAATIEQLSREAERLRAALAAAAGERAALLRAGSGADLAGRAQRATEERAAAQARALELQQQLQDEAAAKEELAAELAGRAAELAGSGARLAEREAEAAHLRAAAAVLRSAHNATIAALQAQLEARAVQVAELADANMTLRVGAGRLEQLLAQTLRAVELRDAEILRLRNMQLPGSCPAPAAAPAGQADSVQPDQSRGTKGDRGKRLVELDQGAEPKQARQLRAALAASEAQRARDGAAHEAELAALRSAHRKQECLLQGRLAAAAHAQGAAGSLHQQYQPQRQQQQQVAGSGPSTPEIGATWRRPVLSLSSEEAAPSETCAGAAPGRAAAAAMANMHGARGNAGDEQLVRVAELERQVLAWQQRCRDLEEQLSALHHAQAERPMADERMPGAEVLQEGFFDNKAHTGVPFPLHEYLSPGVLKGALMGASASWRRATAPAAQAACQAAWDADCAASGVHGAQVSAPQVGGDAFHGLPLPEGCTLAGAEDKADGGSGGRLLDAWAQGGWSLPSAELHQQRERETLNTNLCRSDDGSSLFSIEEGCAALQYKEDNGAPNLSLLLQAVEAAVVTSEPSHEHQQQELPNPLPHSPGDSAVLKDARPWRNTSAAPAPREWDSAATAMAEELANLRSSSVAAQEQQTTGSERCQICQRDSAAAAAAAAAEELGAVRSDIVAALGRRAQLEEELANLEAGVGEAHKALARTRAQAGEAEEAMHRTRHKAHRAAYLLRERTAQLLRCGSDAGPSLAHEGETVCQ